MNCIEEVRNYRDIHQISPETNYLIRIERVLPDQIQYIKNESGEKIVVSNSMILCRTTESWFLGEVRDFKSAARIVNESKNQQTVVLDLKDINENFVASLAPYGTHNEIQNVVPECIKIIILDFSKLNSELPPRILGAPLTSSSSQ